MRGKKTCGQLCAAMSLLAVLLGIDQGSKLLAVKYLRGKPPCSLIPGVFELQYLENEGAAFGLLQRQQLLFVALTAVVIAVTLWLFLQRIPGSPRFRPLNMVCLLVIAGAAGNLIDRLRQQYVVDFLYVAWIDFPVFNVADCYVTIGTAALILLLVAYYREEELVGIL